MQAVCARCGASCEIAQPAQLLHTVFCTRCSGEPAVAAFIRDETLWHAGERLRADAARARFEARKRRLLLEERLRLDKLAKRSQDVPATSALPDHIRAAAARARGRTPSSND